MDADSEAASLHTTAVRFARVARFGPTTPTRAGRLADASVDETDARKTIRRTLRESSPIISPNRNDRIVARPCYAPRGPRVVAPRHLDNIKPGQKLRPGNEGSSPTVLRPAGKGLG
jgi:hypothetical protein